MASITFQILGCGSSGGVPRLGEFGVLATLVTQKMTDNGVHY